jgi:uncharacterized protein YndB with AHSA1/START domain
MTQQQGPETSPTVVRTTDLDMAVDELWQLISTADGWRGWLVDDAEIDVSPGSSGSASDAGVRREVRIDHVNERRNVDFVWWQRDEPSSKSYVQLEIVELPTGGSRLNVTEQLVGAKAATMSSSVEAWWQVRFVSLWLLALHSTVMA